MARALLQLPSDSFPTVAFHALHLYMKNGGSMGLPLAVLLLLPTVVLQL
jgi:hypothetical protein